MRGSVLTFQNSKKTKRTAKSMLTSFGNGTSDFTLKMEIFSGAGIFIILMALGINLLIISSKTK